MICNRKPHSEETKAKISATLFGRQLSDETKNKMSIAKRNKQSNMYGKQHSAQTKAKMSAAVLGKIRSDDTKCKMSIAKIGNKNPMYGRVGRSHPMYDGGKSFEPYCPKFNEDLKRRIRAFFNYECLTCNKSTKDNGRQLSCHHVNYDKQGCCTEKPVQFAALCMKCHNRTNQDRVRWEAILHRIIDEIYDGKSYLPKKFK